MIKHLSSLSIKTKHELHERLMDKGSCLRTMVPFLSGFDIFLSEYYNEDHEIFANLEISYEIDDDELSINERRQYLEEEEFNFHVKGIEAFSKKY